MPSSQPLLGSSGPRSRAAPTSTEGPGRGRAARARPCTTFQENSAKGDRERDCGRGRWQWTSRWVFCAGPLPVFLIPF